MLKVLITSFAISPIKGSEAGMGWDFCSRIGRHCVATVLYGSEERTFKQDFSVDRYIKENGAIPNVHFIWVEATPFAKKLLRLHDAMHVSLFYYWAYKLWQKNAYKLAMELEKTEKFDILHHFNMIGFREPGYLWKMDRPFIWGPVGGTVNVHLRYWKILGLKAIIKIITRNLANYAQLNLSRKVQSAGKKSNIIIAASSTEMENLLRRFPKKNITVINETGANYSFKPGYKRRIHKLELVWSGQHRPMKALPFLLYALHLLPREVDYHVNILGTGPETRRWRKIAQKLDLDKRISWQGWLDREAALRLMGNADLFVFTSLKEGTSTVVMESIALGTPVICLDVCGMRDVVDPTCGRKIALDSPQTIINNLAFTLLELYEDWNLLKALSAGALQRAELFTWDHKVSQIADAYKKAAHA